jgi:hypothetical protein
MLMLRHRGGQAEYVVPLRPLPAAVSSSSNGRSIIPTTVSSSLLICVWERERVQFYISLVQRNLPLVACSSGELSSREQDVVERQKMLFALSIEVNLTSDLPTSDGAALAGRRA